MEMKEKTKVIKTALAKDFGPKNVSVTKGTGTASGWVTSTVYVMHVCDQGSECRSSRWPHESVCKESARFVHNKIQRMAREALASVGEKFYSFSSDDGYPSAELDCHSINVYMRV